MQTNHIVKAATMNSSADPFLKTLVIKLAPDRRNFVRVKPSRDEITLYMYRSQASVQVPAVIGGVLSIPMLLLGWYAINKLNESVELAKITPTLTHHSECVPISGSGSFRVIVNHIDCPVFKNETATDKASVNSIFASLGALSFGLFSIPLLIAAYYNYKKRADKNPFMSFDSEGVKHFGKRVLFWQDVVEINRESRTIPGTFAITPFICYQDKNKISLFELFGALNNNSYDPNSPLTMKDLTLLMNHYLAKYNPKFKNLSEG
jgi:hypothetical protein